MSWKRYFVREEQRRESLPEETVGRESALTEPRQLLLEHRTRLNALRLESGYDAINYDRLIGAALLHVSEWAHFLPATRAENHCESGGLLRLAIETACFAFRRTDGKFLAGPHSTDVRNRERDRVWRYAALLGGLLRPLGRCATHVKVCSSDGRLIWNALHEPLWQWLHRTDVNRVDVHWRDGIDGRPTSAAATWIASRLIPAPGLSCLQTADESLPEALIRIISGERSGRLCEIVEEAYQAAIDQDLSRRGSGDAAMQAGVQIEHRLLEALRALCREKWTLNTPGGRLWYTESGVYLVWKAAANDVIVRLRAEGINGMPRDADTLAELLLAHGVFAPNPDHNAGLKHYYKLIPQMRGVPKHGLEVVKVADTQLLGLQLESVERIPAELAGATPPRTAPVQDKESAPASLELPLAPSSNEGGPAADSQLQQVTIPPLPPPRPSAAASVNSENQAGANLERLRRFGAPGLVLQRLAQHLLAEPGSLPVVPLPEGVALGFPEAIGAFCSRPQEFLAACETQGLLIPETAGGRKFLRKRATDQTHLPAQYVVLAPRAAKYLPVAGGPG